MLNILFNLNELHLRARSLFANVRTETLRNCTRNRQRSSRFQSLSRVTSLRQLDGVFLSIVTDLHRNGTRRIDESAPGSTRQKRKTAKRRETANDLASGASYRSTGRASINRDVLIKPPMQRARIPCVLLLLRCKSIGRCVLA